MECKYHPNPINGDNGDFDAGSIQTQVMSTKLSRYQRNQFLEQEGYDWEGNCLEDAQHLTEVEIHFHVLFQSISALQDKEKGEKEEVVMEKLKPNPNLKRFKLSFYSGKKIARWGRAQDNCDRLQELPVFSKLPHLKRLCLANLENLEYMEEEVCSPLLVVHGAADMVTDPNVNKFLYDQACSKDKTLKLYEGGYHSILEGEPDEAISRVFSDIVQWLDAKCST